jgi:hypothetical protein
MDSAKLINRVHSYVELYLLGRFYQLMKEFYDRYISQKIQNSIY